MNKQDYISAMNHIKPRNQAKEMIEKHLMEVDGEVALRDKKSMDRQNKAFKYKHQKVFLAVAAALIVMVGVPVSAAAARQIWQAHMEVDTQEVGDFGVEYTFEAETGENTESLIHVPVKLEFGYIPDGYVSDGGIKYSLNRNGINGFSVIVYQVGESNSLYFQNVLSSKELEINGRRAVLQKNAQAWDSLLIFFDEYGYAVQIFYQGMTEEEVMNVGNEFLLVQTDKADSVQVTDSKYSAPGLTTASAIGYASVGDEICGYWDGRDTMLTSVSFVVEDVQILDSFNTFDQSKLADSVSEFVGADGSILPANIIKNIRGDGINTQDAKEIIGTLDQKIVYLTIKCKNKSSVVLNNKQIVPTLKRLNLKTGGYTGAIGSYAKAFYSDLESSTYSENGVAQCFLQENLQYSLQPNAEFEYHLAYLCCEESLEYMLADFYGGVTTSEKNPKSYVQVIEVE